VSQDTTQYAACYMYHSRLSADMPAISLRAAGWQRLDLGQCLRTLPSLIENLERLVALGAGLGMP
jgi:hypothetical protein